MKYWNDWLISNQLLVIEITVVKSLKIS